MKRPFVSFALALISAVAGASAVLWLKSSPQKKSSIEQIDALEFIRDVLKLGVVEIRISQIYEIQKDNLVVSEIPIPWTGQKSVVAVKGKGLAGYNLEQVHINPLSEKKEIIVTLPPPTVLSVDLDFDVIHEEDTFFNRLTPQDRNKIQRELKERAAKSLETEKMKQMVESRTEELLKSLSRFLGYPVKRGVAGG